MTTDRPREIVIHQSANRPNQILGGDRELVLLTILVSVSLAFSLATLWGIVWQWRSGSGPLLSCNEWARPIRCCGRSTCGTYDIGRSIRQRADCSASVCRTLPSGGEDNLCSETNTEQHPRGLADLLLPYALIDDGILLQQDGSLAGGLVVSRSRHDVRCGIRNGCPERAPEPRAAAGIRLDGSMRCDPLPCSRLSRARRLSGCGEPRHR